MIYLKATQKEMNSKSKLFKQYNITLYIESQFPSKLHIATMLHMIVFYMQHDMESTEIKPKRNKSINNV